ncbi:hypothetical protein K488DRAFT_47803 [Vararia minispora EC-137]|uniref:Uncharacterized protein n=1 Tax=Vararia minispora EC-137 TaxID=1314806 RepID=A0ACB8QP35_9AGAM|nr:hypothetical protein K488DRAFT_47803 [Vararia minispora EC-137]
MPSPRASSASQHTTACVPGPSTPKKIRATPAGEKRLARFKPRCPQNILDRLDRVMSQRFFMVDRRREDGELREEFSVLGSTGNVYTVTIAHLPSCSCPDAVKGNHCKHILFVFLKVLQVSQSSELWYQKALLSEELETIFSEAPLAPNALAHPHVLEAYTRATGRQPSASALQDGGAATGKRRMPSEGDDCPVCYESMLGTGEKTLTFCEACGNALHDECFRQWAASAAKLTCVYCRAPWVRPTAARRVDGGIGTSREGYLNLGRVAGLSPVRDTSSYYDGPSRGRRRQVWEDEYGGDDAGRPEIYYPSSSY